MVFEPDAARAERLKSEPGVRVFQGEQEAFQSAKPDLVFVCSPTALHVSQALRAVEEGAHVFIEKPLSHTMESVRELLEKARTGKRVVMVGCNMRFHPGHAAIHRFLAEGAIGSPVAARISYGGYLPSWRPGQDYRKSYSASPEQGGAVLDCIHEIDLALWHFGPAEVSGSAVLPATAIGLETDGLAEILLRHASGVLSSVHVNFIQREFRRTCSVIGTDGSLTWDCTRGSVERFGTDGNLAETIAQPAGWETDTMYRDELRHFLAAAEEGKIPTGSLQEASAALAVALAVRESP